MRRRTRRRTAIGDGDRLARIGVRNRGAENGGDLSLEAGDAGDRRGDLPRPLGPARLDRPLLLLEVALHRGQGLDQAAEAEAEVVAGHVGEELLRLAVAIVLGLFGLGDFDQRGPQQDGERDGADPAGNVDAVDAAEVGDVARHLLRHEHGEAGLGEPLVVA